MTWALALPKWQRTLSPSTSAGKERTETGGVAVDEDVELMLRVKAGDAAAFNALMDKYQKTVLNLVYRFTGDAENAEDLAQEVFLRVYRAAPRYEPRAKFFTYLYQVTLNLCRNEREKSQRRRAQSLDQSHEQVVDPENRAEDQIEAQERAAEVQAALLEIPNEQRHLLVLQRFQNLGYEQLAEITGQTVSAVKAKLHRARLSLKKRLEKIL
jgi:RNA polymerase sigma-70 factor (ECF subfamily)